MKGEGPAPVETPGFFYAFMYGSYVYFVKAAEVVRFQVFSTISVRILYHNCVVD